MPYRHQKGCTGGHDRRSPISSLILVIQVEATKQLKTGVSSSSTQGKRVTHHHAHEARRLDELTSKVDVVWK